MDPIDPRQGLSTLVNHVGEGHNPQHSHVTPIYQTSTFSFPDVETGAATFKGQKTLMSIPVSITPILTNYPISMRSWKVLTCCAPSPASRWMRL